MSHFWTFQLSASGYHTGLTSLKHTCFCTYVYVLYLSTQRAHYQTLKMKNILMSRCASSLYWKSRGSNLLPNCYQSSLR